MKKKNALTDINYISSVEPYVTDISKRHVVMGKYQNKKGTTITSEKYDEIFAPLYNKLLKSKNETERIIARKAINKICDEYNIGLNSDGYNAILNAAQIYDGLSVNLEKLEDPQKRNEVLLSHNIEE